jgi:hypothetical protein
MWVKCSREVYKLCLKEPSDFCKESPGIVLGTNKLSRVWIERLDAIGFVWTMNCSWAEHFQEWVAFKVTFFTAVYCLTILHSRSIYVTVVNFGLH